MRILRIYPFLPPLRGGMEKHILRLTQEQRKLGCEVTVAFNQGDATASGDLRVLPKVDLRRIKPQALRDLMFYCALFLKLARLRKRFDVVHVHGDWSAFFLGRLCACLARPGRLAASVHDSVKHETLCSISLAGYHLVYATGAQDAELLSSDSRPIYWQHSGIDDTFLTVEKGAEKSCDVICVGSFVPKKNVELVVKIAAAMPDVSFRLVGDGPLKTAIEAGCLHGGIANIAFTGQLAPSGVASQLHSARIFLLTSFAEGTPTALLEAMGCGLAIVTSRSNAYEDLIRSGENGHIIDGFEADDYVRAIRELLSDAGRLDAICRNNSEQATSYSWSHVSKRITQWMHPDAS